MTDLLKQIESFGVVPVLVPDSAEEGLRIAEALVAGGLPCVEVTFRTAAAADTIKLISRRLPDVLVGAGTVLTKDQAAAANECGAKFIVTPGFNPSTVDFALERGIKIIPGTATPGEMEQAMERGLNAVKFFPAEQMGGVEYLKAVSGPYKTLRFLPTGGISLKNLPDYLKLKQVLACGGSWLCKGTSEEISQMAADAVKISKEIKGL